MSEPNLSSSSSSMLALCEAGVSLAERTARARPLLRSQTQARVTQRQSLQGPQHAQHVCPRQAALPGQLVPTWEPPDHRRTGSGRKGEWLLLNPAQEAVSWPERQGHPLLIPHGSNPSSTVMDRAGHPAFMTHSGWEPRGSSGWSEVGFRNGWHILATTVTTDSVQAKDKAPDCECFSWDRRLWLQAQP